MDNENGSPPGKGQPPEQHLTVNQVVAWNLAFYRRTAGLTQADLGVAIGWTKSAVSDAERSWTGKWTREFDAHTLVVIAAALGVPVGALFLPPSDDQIAALYYIEIPGDDGCPERLDMTDLLTLVMPDSDSGTDAMEAYRDRLRAEAGNRFSEYWRNELGRWLTEARGPDLRADFVAQIRMRRDQLLAMAAEEADWADAIEEGAGS